MRTRRVEKFQNADIAAQAAEILKENTYGGGGKHSRRSVPRKVPQISMYQGISMEWDSTAEEYPSTIKILMTDGEWVKYQKCQEQPKPAALLETSERTKTGYPVETSEKTKTGYPAGA